jgi:hypothetical protein
LNTPVYYTERQGNEPMGLFDGNVTTMRKVVENLWRDISREAAGFDLLDLKEAKVEVRIIVTPKDREPRIESKVRLMISAMEPAKIKRVQGETLWRRIMTDED